VLCLGRHRALRGRLGRGSRVTPGPGQTALRCWPARHPGAPGSRSARWVTISASSTTISDAAEVRVSTHRRVAAGVLAMPAAPIVCSRLPLSGPARYDTARGLPGPHRSVCAADGDHLRQADRGAADEQGPMRACDGDPREDLNRRGLARAVRAEEGEDRSRRTWTSMPATASRLP
jgi:hypothetical protein